MARVAWRDLTFWGKIASNIRCIRRWRGLTDIQVAEGTQIDIKRYRKIERGDTGSLTLKEVTNLVKIFKVLPEEIVNL